LYKYHIVSNKFDWTYEKADPLGFAMELRPKSASVAWRPNNYQWSDSTWLQERESRQSHQAPISIYEVHLGSWMRNPDDNNGWLSYRDVAHKLADYVADLGYTHIELMPVTEYPFDASWGYQVLGYFAPTARFGTPDDFKYFVDVMHQRGIGVLMDWVPAHFPKDGHGLYQFDGSHLYEHDDPRLGEHPDWGTAIFNYGRFEVQNFLISNARYWIDQYHIDGLRVDAVASMLYLDYSREEGQWYPNEYGGNENLPAMNFLRRLNEVVYGDFPGVLMIAEESTAWGGVSRPTSTGGLGFGFKWDMGWMHDTLKYLAKEPIHRQYHQNDITFRALYAFTENFVLSLSHDEVVHGKQNIVSKMPGDMWQQFANTRLLYGYQYTLPGKKLLFMGAEFGQWDEWYFDKSLDWHLLQYPIHQGLQRWVRDINHFYRNESALYKTDCDPNGFAWVCPDDAANSVLTYRRHDPASGRDVVVACNFTPVPRESYRIGVPKGGYWREALNSDAEMYGGSNMGNAGGCQASDDGWNFLPHSITVTLPPLATVVFVGPGQ
jgi:1,4-alpha-glucan branching enzyme